MAAVKHQPCQVLEKMEIRRKKYGVRKIVGAGRFELARMKSQNH